MPSWRRLSRATAAVGALIVAATGFLPAAAQAQVPSPGPSLADLQSLTDAATLFPDQLAGVSTDGPVRVTLHVAGSGALTAAVGAAVARLRAAGAQVAIKAEKYNARELGRVNAQIQDSPIFAPAAAGLSNWGVDPATNAVDVGVVAVTPALRAQVQAVFGDRVRLSQAPRLYGAGRFNDSPPLYGGDRITGGASGTNCTSGFAIRNRAGVEYMVTAGHCYGQGVSVSANTHLLQVGFQRFANNEMDDELLQNIPGGETSIARASGHIWDGGINTTTNVGVTDARDSCTNCQVFFGGSYTGKSLGTLVGSLKTARECLNSSCSSYYVVLNVQEVLGQNGNGICQHGDSGGPVYASNSTGVTAVGIITLIARDANGVEHTNDCYYTSMIDILRYWDAAIQFA